MEKGFKTWRLRSALPVGLMAVGLLTAWAVIGLPGRTQQKDLSLQVQRRDNDLGATNPCLSGDGASPQALPGTPGNVEFVAGCSGSQHHSAGFGD